MSTFFSRERFGQPQVIAGMQLLIFIGQCVWLVSRDLRANRVDPDEMFRIEAGLNQWGAPQKHRPRTQAMRLMKLHRRRVTLASTTSTRGFTT